VTQLNIITQSTL